jgi:starch synthase (maltosyl-transferring)
MNMKGPKKMMIYNLFPLLTGPLPTWKVHFARIRDMGFNWVFVNPIQEPGMSGSIYAIRNYFEVNPVLLESNAGDSKQQVREMVGAAEEQGLGLMIDLVINHCSIDSPLLNEHPAWFEWDGKGEVVHPYATHNLQKVVWGDLARFNSGNSGDREGLHRYRLEVIRHLVDLGFKGFRCDAAYQIPAEHWKRLIDDARGRHPDLLFVAETLGCTPKQTRNIVGAGFDYIFNSSKWWDYRSHWLMNQYHLLRDIVPSISFPESHDTERLCEELKGNLDGIKQRYLFSGFFSAGVMIPMGFEFGFRKKLHVVKTTPSDWERTGIDLSTFIKKVNKIRQDHEIFQEECATQVFTEGNPRVMVLWKGSSRTGQEALVLLNKDIYGYQSFKAGDIYDFFESKAPIMDVSPENPLKEVPVNFSFELAPGEGRVLMPKEENAVD